MQGVTPDPTEVSPEGDLVYRYRPSLMGAPCEFTLMLNGLAWAVGHKTGFISFDHVGRLRMSFKPVSMQSYRFVTELWADGTPKLEIVSSSWKNIVEHERLDRPYATFITELHRRIARTNRRVRYERGSHSVVYWPGFVLFGVVSLTLAALIAQALAERAIGGAALVGAFLAFFLWQGGNFFHRNRPGVYHPDALPAELMPAAWLRTTNTEHLA